MKDTTNYVGLDVFKEKIAVVIADESREVRRYWGVILNTPEAIRKLMKQLGEPESNLALGLLTSIALCSKISMSRL